MTDPDLLNTAATLAVKLVVVAIGSMATWAVQRYGSHLNALANGQQQANFELAVQKSVQAAWADTHVAAGSLAQAGAPLLCDLVLRAEGVLLDKFKATAAAVGATKPGDARAAIQRVAVGATLPAPILGGLKS